MRVAALLLLCLPTAAAAAEVYVPPPAFLPIANVVDYGIDQGGLGCLRMYKGSAFFVATVPLPDGAAVSEVTALFEDVNADALGMMSLVRRHETSFELLAATPPSQGSGRVEAVSAALTPPARAREGEALILQVLISGPDVCLHGARVKLASPD